MTDETNVPAPDKDPDYVDDAPDEPPETDLPQADETPKTATVPE